MPRSGLEQTAISRAAGRGEAVQTTRVNLPPGFTFAQEGLNAYDQDRLNTHAIVLAGEWYEGSMGDPGDPIDFRGRYLPGASFAGRDLRGLIFYRADCRSADFRGCDLRRCLFNHACLFRADLRDCDLRDVNFFHADLQLARLAGARLNFFSPELVGEVLWRAARTKPRKLLAALVCHRCLGKDLVESGSPELPWAIRVISRWVRPGDRLPKALASRIKAVAAAAG